MLSIDLSQRPDLTDIADDDVKAVEAGQVQDTFYRVTEKLKRIIEWQDDVIVQMKEAIEELQTLV